jgi:hypothetical protein
MAVPVVCVMIMAVMVTIVFTLMVVMFMPVPVFTLMMVMFMAVVPVAGFMPVTLVPMVMMPVFMAAKVVVMNMAFRFVFVTGKVIRPSFQVHYGVGAGDAPPLVLFKAEFPAPDAEFFQFPPQGGRVHPQVHQSAQAHIAGDAGLTVKMQCLHWLYTIPL